MIMKREKMTLWVLILSILFSVNLFAEEIVIVGTGSGAAVLTAVGKAFTANNPGVTISVPKSIGSGGGIKAVGTDANVLGRVARQLKEREQSYELTYVEYARMPIVFFVNNSVSITNLSAQQACDIYSGKIADWKEVGGKAGKIRVIRREEGDSSLEVLTDTLPCFKGLEITKKSKTTFSDPETVETTGKTSAAIAFGTWPNVMNNKQVKALNIGGNKPTSPEYTYVGILALIYKEKNNTGNIKQFIDFTTSPAARSVITAAGAIPLK